MVRLSSSGIEQKQIVMSVKDQLLWGVLVWLKFQVNSQKLGSSGATDF